MSHREIGCWIGDAQAIVFALAGLVKRQTGGARIDASSKVHIEAGGLEVRPSERNAGAFQTVLFAFRSDIFVDS